eukprot:scaffold65811_cov43-Cyclotella_meneghiniana.AAC.8
MEHVGVEGALTVQPVNHQYGHSYDLRPSGRGSNSKSDHDDGGRLPLNLDSAVTTRLLLEAFLCYEQDYACIADSTYNTQHTVG